jgi:acetyl/propionyl-CoA carboxylase alpha subunit
VLVVLESMKMEIPLLARAMAWFNRFTCSRAARYAPGSGWR